MRPSCSIIFVYIYPCEHAMQGIYMAMRPMCRRHGTTWPFGMAHGWHGTMVGIPVVARPGALCSAWAVCLAHDTAQARHSQKASMAAPVLLVSSNGWPRRPTHSLHRAPHYITLSVGSPPTPKSLTLIQSSHPAVVARLARLRLRLALIRSDLPSVACSTELVGPALFR